MMQKPLREPPHPPLSPVAGERAGVRGQRSPKEKSSNALPIAFANNTDKVAESDCLCFFAPVEFILFSSRCPL